jgi:transposase-like protein
MKKRTPKDWRRLVAAYESGTENRREFCERRALSTSTLDYWRRRSRADAGGRLVEVEIETDAGTAGALTDSLVITWPNGVCVEMGAGVASAAVVSALHGAFGGGGSCSR